MEVTAEVEGAEERREMRTLGLRVDKQAEDRIPPPQKRNSIGQELTTWRRVPSHHWRSQKGRAVDLGTMPGPKARGWGLDLWPPLTPAEKPALLGKTELRATSLGVGRPG